MLLPHELPKNLDLRFQETRRNQETLKTSNKDSLGRSLPVKLKTLLKLTKNAYKTEIKLLPQYATSLYVYMYIINMYISILDIVSYIVFYMYLLLDMV